jgi:hypothetical protein
LGPQIVEALQARQGSVGTGAFVRPGGA